MFARRLASDLSSRNHEILLLLDGTGPFQTEMQADYAVHVLDQQQVSIQSRIVAGIRLPRLTSILRTAFWQLKSRKTIKQQLDLFMINSRPDIVIGNGWSSCVTLSAACQRHNIPLLACIHGVGSRHNDVGNIRSRVGAYFLNKANLVIGISNTVLERYRPYLRVPDTILYHAAPALTTTPQSQEFIQRHNLDCNTVLVGSYGAIEHDKGYHVLIRAIAKIHNQPQCALIIGGEPTNLEESRYLNDLHNIASAAGIGDRVFFIGKIQPEQFFSIVNIFCHCYLGEEGLSLAILEAMAAGCPVIATDSGGPTEIISSDSQGQKIPANNELALADAIKNYVTQPEYTRRVVKNALLVVEERFNPESWAGNWEQQLCALVNTYRKTST